jgi:serine O-acetyltransferase
MTLAQIFQNLMLDCRRYNTMARESRPLRGLHLLSVLLRPSLICLALYRLSHFFHLRGHRVMAGILYRLNMTLTGSDVSPISRIGPGCVIVHTLGTIIHGTVGENVLLFGFVSISSSEPPPLDLSTAPVIGNNVTLGTRVSVVGPVKIADDVSIAAFRQINRSIEGPGRLILGPRQREASFFPVNEEVQ